MAKLTAQLTFRVPSAIYRQLQLIAQHERRKMNEVARALLIRGIAAYEHDKQLFEATKQGNIMRVPIVKVNQNDR